MWNYVDWGIYVLLLVYFFGYSDKPDSKENQLIAPIAMILVLYRSFSQMRVIDAFTSLVGMINIIIQKLLVFFIILIYFYVSTAFLMIRLLPENSNRRNFEMAYLWTLFGAIEADDFSSAPYISIAIIFGTIIVTVIMLNILIAYLSNVFSRLEEQQSLNDLREKASMILDMEVILWLFRCKMTGKVGKLKELEHLKQQKYLQNLSSDEDMGTDIPTKHKAILEDQKLFYIFKTLDLEEETEDSASANQFENEFREFNKSYEEQQSQNDTKFLSIMESLEFLKLKLSKN